MELETKEFIGTFRGKIVNVINDEEELTISRSLFQYIKQLEEQINKMREEKINQLEQDINYHRILLKGGQYGR